jgi:hypothetical protein
MQYKMIATDLDDTLLDDKSEISTRNREAVLRAVEAGVRFVIATGRMFKTSVHYLQRMGLDGDCPLINYHGAMVKKSSSGELILHRPISNAIAVTVAEEAEKRGSYVNLFIDDELYIKEENDYSRFYQSMAHMGLKVVGSLAPFLKNNGAEPSKMSIIQWDGTIEALEAELRDKFGSELAILQSRPNFLELTDKRATKGQTLRWLAEQEGIKPEEIIAFGDGHNDLDMIIYAGLGVAVANARPEVIKAADLVTASNVDDGVAEVIERYVLDLSSG